jgi:putative transposase
MGGYRRPVGAVFSLKYHRVWCPKYRRQVLVAPIDARLKELIAEVAAEHELAERSLEVMPGHVPLLIEADPTLCVAEIVNRFKGRSSSVLLQEFPKLHSRLATLWTRSYYGGSVGAVSETVARRYIEAQKSV